MIRNKNVLDIFFNFIFRSVKEDFGLVYHFQGDESEFWSRKIAFNKEKGLTR